MKKKTKTPAPKAKKPAKKAGPIDISLGQTEAALAAERAAFARTYQSLAGSDMHVWFVPAGRGAAKAAYDAMAFDPAALSLAGGFRIGEIMGINVQKEGASSVSGSLCFCIFDRTQFALFESGPLDILVVGINEYGFRGACLVEAAEFRAYGFGVAVDDIAFDESMTYAAKAFHPWKFDSVSAAA